MVCPIPYGDHNNTRRKQSKLKQKTKNAKRKQTHKN